MSRAQKKPDPGTMDKITEMLGRLELGQKEMIETIRQEMAAMKEDIRKENAELRKDLTDVKQTTDESKKRVGDLERGLKAVQGGRQNLENVVLNLQFEKSLSLLRFQNIEEEEGENLKEKMSQILAEFTGKELDHLRWDIDQVYRVNSQYVKIHKVPREIHVKFVKMATRDEILGARRRGPLEHGGKEITILKQIPKKIREIRRKYFFLSNKLYLKGVMFRWLVPEGLMVFWEGSRIKINTISQAEAFLKDYGSLLDATEIGVGEGETEQERMEGRGEEAGSALGAEGGEELPRLRSGKQ